MDNTLEEFLRILAIPVLLVLSYCHILLSLTSISFPLNYLIALLPLYITFCFWLKEIHRRTRLGFAHDRIREIPEARVQNALEQIEKERRKIKYLP